MTTLLIDLGNSQLKWRSWEPASRLCPGGTLQHDSDGLSSQLASALPAATAAHIACVARPDLRQQLQNLLDHKRITARWAQSPRQGLGLTSRYPDPKKWGVDRYLALAAAYAGSGRACCVVDIGTAITVDVCDDQGQQCGGSIAPGPAALLGALSHRTALPAASDQWPEILGLACDTEAALLLGALHSACGGIERAVAYAQQHHGCERIVLTGGWAGRLSPHLGFAHQLDPDLVFKGLAMLAHSDGQTVAHLPR